MDTDLSWAVLWIIERVNVNWYIWPTATSGRSGLCHFQIWLLSRQLAIKFGDRYEIM